MDLHIADVYADDDAQYSHSKIGPIKQANGKYCTDCKDCHPRARSHIAVLSTLSGLK